MSAVLPDNAAPRCWRYVGPNVLPRHLISIWDRENNVQYIDRAKYDALSFVEQHLLVRTDKLEVEAVSVTFFREVA